MKTKFNKFNESKFMEENGLSIKEIQELIENRNDTEPLPEDARNFYRRDGKIYFQTKFGSKKYMDTWIDDVKFNKFNEGKTSDEEREKKLKNYLKGKNTIGVGFTDYKEYIEFRDFIESEGFGEIIIRDYGKFDGNDSWAYEIDSDAFTDFYGNWYDELKGDFNSVFFS